LLRCPTSHQEGSKVAACTLVRPPHLAHMVTGSLTWDVRSAQLRNHQRSHNKLLHAGCLHPWHGKQLHHQPRHLYKHLWRADHRLHTLAAQVSLQGFRKHSFESLQKARLGAYNQEKQRRGDRIIELPCRAKPVRRSWSQPQAWSFLDSLVDGSRYSTTQPGRMPVCTAVSMEGSGRTFTSAGCVLSPPSPVQNSLGRGIFHEVINLT
jgi:hypothetical protein